MPRPVEVDLTTPNPEWREVPMPGANAAFALRRLDSDGESFVVHGRFPPGFDRPTPGGYLVAEEFLVLDGELVLEGTTYRRGDLTYVPARFLRTSMLTHVGCTVLAWFGGPAVFHEQADLPDPVAEGIWSVEVGAARPGDVHHAGDATWTVLTPAATTPVHTGDLVRADLGRWLRVAGEVTADAPHLLRTAAPSSWE